MKCKVTDARCEADATHLVTSVPANDTDTAPPYWTVVASDNGRLCHDHAVQRAKRLNDRQQRAAKALAAQDAKATATPTTVNGLPYVDMRMPVLVAQELMVAVNNHCRACPHNSCDTCLRMHDAITVLAEGIRAANRLAGSDGTGLVSP